MSGRCYGTVWGSGLRCGRTIPDGETTCHLHEHKDVRALVDLDRNAPKHSTYPQEPTAERPVGDAR